MELVSMEIQKSEVTDFYARPLESAEAEGPKYPYGLKIDLEGESLKKLGLVDLPKVGTKMTLTAQVEVCSVSQYESKDGNADQRVSIQIEAMALEPVKAAVEEKEDPSKTLYGQES